MFNIALRLVDLQLRLIHSGYWTSLLLKMRLSVFLILFTCTLSPVIKISMKLLYGISILLCTLLTVTRAQENKNLGLGVNVSNNFINLALGNYRYQGGICVEPLIMYRINDRLDIKTVIGYSKISSIHELPHYNNPVQILNYINNGFYFKCGIFTGFRHNEELFHQSFGVSLFYSRFREYGDLTIKGDYFGDFKTEYKVSRQSALFLEPRLDLFIFQNEHVDLMISMKFPFPVYKMINEKYPNYYVPGYGDRIGNDFDLRFVYCRIDLYLMVPLKI